MFVDFVLLIVFRDLRLLVSTRKIVVSIVMVSGLVIAKIDLMGK